jgi:hypothetical protein
MTAISLWILLKAWSPPDAEQMSMAQFLERIPQGFNIRAWHAARRLFARNYWKRAWIFQEIVFSKQATVLCGSKHVSWGELGRAQVKWQQLKSQPENFHLLKQDQLKMVQLTFFDTIAAISLHHLLQRLDESRGLFQLLNSTDRSHATDPRDKIYALLGFSEVAVLDLEPDYKKPVERVYGEFVQAYVEGERKLNVLFMTGIGYGKAETIHRPPIMGPGFSRLCIQFTEQSILFVSLPHRRRDIGYHHDFWRLPDTDSARRCLRCNHGSRYWSV